MGKNRTSACMLVEKIARFIQKTSSSLPDDAEQAIRKALRRETKGSSARMVLETILRNVELARTDGTPVCQDTGTLTFFVSESLRRRVTPAVLGEAVARAPQYDRFRDGPVDRHERLPRRAGDPLRGGERRRNYFASDEGGRVGEHEPAVLAARRFN